MGQLFFGWLNEIFVKALKVFIIVEAAATDDASLVDDGEAHGIGWSGDVWIVGQKTNETWMALKETELKSLEYLFNGKRLYQLRHWANWNTTYYMPLSQTFTTFQFYGQQT